MTEYEKLYLDKKKKICRLAFDPQDDITAHELSLLIPMIVPSRWKTQDILNQQYEQLPNKCKRHIKVSYKE